MLLFLFTYQLHDFNYYVRIIEYNLNIFHHYMSAIASLLHLSLAPLARSCFFALPTFFTWLVRWCVRGCRNYRDVLLPINCHSVFYINAVSWVIVKIVCHSIIYIVTIM